MDNNNFDQFPINIFESNGPIEKKGFFCKSSCFRVWRNGMVIVQGNEEIDLRVYIIEGGLHVEIRSDILAAYTENKFFFTHISLNRDRVLWINLYNQGSEPKQPSALSLFYKNSKLARIAISIEIPQVLIEFDLLPNTDENSNEEFDSGDEKKLNCIQRIIKKYFS